MTVLSERRRTAVADAVAAGLGAMALTAPGATARAVGAPTSHLSLTVVRVLGARQVLQVAALQVRPGAKPRALGRAVDLAHAATMVALAVARPGLRRPALTSACLATAFAVAGGA